VLNVMHNPNLASSEVEMFLDALLFVSGSGTGCSTLGRC